MTTIDMTNPDTAARFHMLQLRGALRLYVNTGGQILVTRGASLSRLLPLVSRYTGKKYKRSMPGAVAAVADLDALLG